MTIMKPFALALTTALCHMSWPTIENAPSGEIISKPKLIEHPGYGRVGKIRVLVSKFYDADDYILEANQILTD